LGRGRRGFNAHLGTGNYHPSTARIYTDIGMFTCRESITEDLAELFNLITGISKFEEMNELVCAPFNLYEQFIALIEQESRNALAGKPAGIYAKINSLIDEGIIEALYRASASGVPIRLLVRGMCALRPGIKGVSETIEVRSIVGRFLEHSRIFRFENTGDPIYLLGSADWMHRNLFRRVETAFPISSEGMRSHVEEILTWFWKDNVKARIMQPHGTYQPVLRRHDEAPFDAQAAFLEDAQRRRKSRLLIA